MIGKRLQLKGYLARKISLEKDLIGKPSVWQALFESRGDDG
jgi:hypothetical protein